MVVSDVHVNLVDSVKASVMEAMIELDQAWQHLSGDGTDHPVEPHIRRAMQRCNEAMVVLTDEDDSEPA